MKLLFPVFFVFLFLIPSEVTAQQVPDDASKVSPLLISATIPDVSLRNIDNELINLKELVSEQPTMLVFYRGGWCPYCSRHLSELKQVEDEILSLGWNIVAISVDRPEVLKKTVMEGDLKYTLLSDSPAEVIKAFGLAFRVPQTTIDRYESIGIDLEGDSGFDHHLLPAPAVYMIDTEGKVLFQYVNPNYRERIAGEVLLAAAKAYL